MKSSLIILCSLLIALAMGCESTRDMAAELAGRTDLAVGQVYRLKKPAAVYRRNGIDDREGLDLEPLGYNQSPRDLDSFKRMMTQITSYAGILMPGSLIMVKDVEMHHNRSFGDFLHVYGVINSGELKGTYLNMVPILSRKPSHEYAYVDPEYLELVK